MNIYGNNDSGESLSSRVEIIVAILGCVAGAVFLWRVGYGHEHTAKTEQRVQVSERRAVEQTRLPRATVPANPRAATKGGGK